MTRLVIRLELETQPNGRNESADQVIDLGLLAPSLSPAEIGEEVLKWLPRASEDLMFLLRECDFSVTSRAKVEGTASRHSATPNSLPAHELSSKGSWK